MLNYSKFISRKELYQLLDRGLDDIANGRTQKFSAAMKDIREDIANDRIG